MLTLMLLFLGIQSAKKGVQITKRENEAIAKTAVKDRPKPMFKVVCVPGSFTPQCVNTNAPEKVEETAMPAETHMG